MPPSGSPTKEQILDNLQTTREGITAGADYYNTVAFVTRVDTVPIELKEYPEIVMVPPGAD